MRASRLVPLILLVALWLLSDSRAGPSSPLPWIHPARADTLGISPTPAAESPLEVVGQIGGPTQAVALQGDRAYIGVGLRLVVLDLSNPAAPRELGVTQPFGSFVEGVAVSGTVAYVAAGASGLQVIDVSDPAHPLRIGAWDSPGFAEGVAVAGETVYLADGPFGLRVVDVSDPANPREVGSAYPMNYAFNVAVRAAHAYVAAAGAGLLVADLSDPAHPIELAAVDTPGYAYGVAATEGMVYVADGWEGIRLVSVADPAHPVQVGEVATPGWAFGVAVSGPLAYVADSFKGLRVVNISDPTRPTEIGGVEVAGGHAGAVAVRGGKAFVADRNWGLWIADVSSPSRPVRLGSYAPLGYADGVAVSGGYAYVAAGSFGLRVVDVSDPARPRQVGIYDTRGFATSVAVVGGYAYVATTLPGESMGLHVVDVRNPSQPTRAAFIAEQEGGVQSLAVSGGFAYLTNELGLRVIDVSNPIAPRAVGYISLMEWPRGDILTATWRVAVADSLAFVTTSRAGLKIVDVSVPSTPTLIGSLRWPDAFAKDVVLRQGLAFVTDWNGVTAVDVSNPRQPVRLDTYRTRGMATEGVGMADGEVLVTDGAAGIVGVEFSTEGKLVPAWSYNTAGYAQEVVGREGYAYVADQDGGLLILRKAAASAAGSPAHTLSESNTSGWQTDPRSRALPAPESPIARARDGLSGAESTRRPVDGLVNLSAVGYELGRIGLGAVPAATTCTVTVPADSGPGSLRACLESAASGTSILFDPSAFPPNNPVPIPISAPLPRLSRGGITIDASNSGVILDGRGAPPGTSGLVIVSGGNVVRGLQILRFPGYGVSLQDGARQNLIGGNRERGSGPLGEGNLISGNSQAGVQIKGEGTEANVVTGNLIGTDLSGTSANGNSNVGVHIHSGARGNRVGAPTPGERNVISGNGQGGISVFGADARDNVFLGNYIGTDATGTSALGNGGNGVGVASPDNRIGGPGPGEGNLISANGSHGIGFIGTWATGNKVVGNYVGIDATGSMALGNADHGVAIEMGANANVVERNVVITEGRNAVLINDWGSSYNTIVGNLLGTDAGGTVALGGGFQAVAIGMGAGFNRVGGTRAEDRNVIVGGFTVFRGSGPGNLLMGNFVGTDVTGTKGISKMHEGVALQSGARRPFIGGTTEAERNVISGNRGAGIIVAPAVDDVFIGGNYIGTDPTGTIAVGNAGDGITISDGDGNVIQGNLIAHNSGIGVNVTGAHNTLRQNSIHSHRQRGISRAGGGNGPPTTPTISAVTTAGISGTAPPGSRVEIFSDDEDEGRVYEGSAVADASGVFVFDKGDPLAGPLVTTTATDRGGDTSEFSTPQRVPR